MPQHPTSTSITTLCPTVASLQPLLAAQPWGHGLGSVGAPAAAPIGIDLRPIHKGGGIAGKKHGHVRDFLRRALLPSGHVRVPLCGDLGKIRASFCHCPIHKRPRYVPYADDVAAHPLFGILHTNALREGGGGALARSVRMPLWAQTQAHRACDGGVVNEAAGLLLYKLRQKFVDDVEVRLQVQVNALFPCLFCHLVKAHR
mmetsp:Transcript_25011/g.39531  ORF Transcript_25011/g.39531 Transcript_25011/m.39531 type:complete len:201 (+) Transcript_25011:78-680(+)